MDLVDRTYAVVVAIEEYPELGPNWTLPGVGARASEFVRWLAEDKHVPAENIKVFKNGAANFGLAAVADPQSDPINKFLANVGANWPQGELLLLYWVGHGFVSRDGSRRLFFGDATNTVKSNLDVEQFLQLLRSTARGGFAKQIAIIDTCARFFETLQTTKGLPRGGLPEGLVQKEGVQQYFYFAASSGQYATQGAFGAQVLDLLRGLPAHEWPPNPRALRDGIEGLFDRLTTERKAGQQPAWLEYRDGKDNRLVRGELPTLGAIHDVAQRAMVPLRHLRTLTELAVNCASLMRRDGRDALAESLRTPKPLFRPVETREDADLDLMSLIAGSLQQNVEQKLAAEIVRMESNSNSAFLFEKTISEAAILREFWPILARIRVTIGRAQVLFRASHQFWTEDREPESVEEALQILMDLGTIDSLVEFLVRVAHEHPGDPNCGVLKQWLQAQCEWTTARLSAEAHLKEEVEMRRYLLVRVEERNGVGRVTRAWLWGGNRGDPLELDALPADGTLAGDIATLLNQVKQMGGKVHLEIMLPEILLHLDSKQLAWVNRGKERNLETLHPVVLRWRERMDTPGDPSFETGRWQQTAAQIERRRQMRAARAEWMSRSCDIDAFCRAFEQGERGEFVGIEVESDGEGRSEVVALICNGGLPYACWPRHKGVNLTDAKAEVGKMLGKNSFDEVPGAKNSYLLSDLLLLWDDPKRNPYERKLREVRQK